MSELDAVRWFKDQFGAAVTEALTGTPFTLDMATAIAMQETYGDCWQFLYQTKTASQVLPLCVGDTLDYPNRTAFPRTKADLCQAPNGQQMFDIAHQALINVGNSIQPTQRLQKTRTNFVTVTASSNMTFSSFATTRNFFSIFSGTISANVWRGC